MADKTLYLAARYSRRDELKVMRDKLVSLGYTITSRWLDFEDENPHIIDQNADKNSAAHARTEYRAMIADMDMADVMSAERLVFFAPGGSRGGCHTEFGMAMAMHAFGFHLTPILVGEPGHVFHAHPRVKAYPDEVSFLHAVETDTLPGY